jgi:putative oxidoreductase
MKKLFSTHINPNLLNAWLLVLRLLIAAFMLTHGFGKLESLLAGGELKFPDPLGVGVGLSLFLAVFAEFFCSILVGIGLATRLAAIPLIVTMLVAAFIQHADDPFGKKEFALLYLLVYVTLLITGGGKYSIDGLLSKRKSG